jgi:hypothetical protein
VKLPEFAYVTFPHSGCWYATHIGRPAYQQWRAVYLKLPTEAKKEHVFVFLDSFLDRMKLQGIL